MNVSTPMPCVRFPLLLLCTALAFAAACGDSSPAPTSTPDGIPLTVFVPVGEPRTISGVKRRFAVLEYRVTCDADPEEDPPFQQATLEAQDAEYGDRRDPTDVWRGLVQAETGECVITFAGLAEDGQYLCTGSNSVTITEDTSALYFDMSYCLYTCIQVELPDTDSAPKTVCLGSAGLLLSAAMPIELDAAVAVHYTLRFADLDGEFEGALQAAGTLERQSLGTADFGQGPVSTSIWQTTVGVLDWAHYHLELTAVDEEGTPLCRTNMRIDLAWNIANKVHVVMPCSQ
jgi:hypothetical protein